MVFRALIVLALLVPSFALAEIIPTIEPSVEVEVIPAHPGPNETVTVRAAAPGNLGGGVTYVWTVNGRVVDQGIGRNTISLITGSAGSETRVAVSILADGGVIVEKTLTIRPASLDIVWEGNTYTPPFYTGRPLPTGSSRVTLTALPHLFEGGARLPAGILVYRWYLNGSQTSVRGGYGLDTIVITTPQFENEFTVSAVAESTSGISRAEGAATIRPVRPAPMVYENAPLVGLRFESAVASFALGGDEATFEAFPFFVNSISGPDYTWRIDGVPVAETGRTERELTLRREGEGEGRFSVSFELENVGVLFEHAKTNFLLTF